MLEAVEQKKPYAPARRANMRTGVHVLPTLSQDQSDRNRTSPFAFTGNRFEFRAVGSQANCAGAMTAINAMVAEQLVEFKKSVDALIAKGVKKDEAIFQEIRRLIIESAPIHFDGNGYSDEWKAEAAKRGLTNITSVPESISKMVAPHAKKVLVESGILTDRELEARADVEYEKYVLKEQIEARVMGEIVINHIVPTALKYQNTLISNVKGMKDVLGAEADALTENEKELIRKISEHVTVIRKETQAMIDARKAANNLDGAEAKAIAYHDNVHPHQDVIRYHVDKLELIIDNEMWPLPKYRELLFFR